MRRLVKDTAWVIKHACDADLCVQFGYGKGVRNLTIHDMQNCYKNYQKREELSLL